MAKEKSSDKKPILIILGVVGCIVIALMGLACCAAFGGLAMFGVATVEETANVTHMKSQFQDIELALEEYRDEHRRYPYDLDELVDGEYITSVEIEGTDVEYERTINGYEMSITLPDGEEYRRVVD